MRRLLLLAALLLAVPAHAVVFDWIEVGDPGNPCDLQPGGCFGSVDYVYFISRYEVTNAQYAEFLNAVAPTDTYGLYNTEMGSVTAYGGITRSGNSGAYSYSAIVHREDLPVNWVSFYDALRFANWLHNGQPMGVQDGSTTEDGAYTITQEGINANSVTRNEDATIFLTSEDEWYKAAYYDPASTSYFGYPAGSNVQTICAVPGAKANTANCWFDVNDSTEAGSYAGSASPYGTFDQGGNVREWNEGIMFPSGRVNRGGGFNSYWGSHNLAAWIRYSADPTNEGFNLGFRVATVAEPPACNDGIDNDGDGLTDYPDDPGCWYADDVSERLRFLVCDDGGDNDGDGLADFPHDPGCAEPADSTETDPNLICDDGLDNDGDGRNDFDPITYADPGDETTPPAGSGDPGCKNPTWFSEEPLCQDGIDNDGDGMMDYDAGLSRNGVADPGGPDPTCVNPYDNRESPCGLGAELALVLPPLMWLYRRRGRRV